MERRFEQLTTWMKEGITFFTVVMGGYRKAKEEAGMTHEVMD